MDELKTSFITVICSQLHQFCTIGLHKGNIHMIE